MTIYRRSTSLLRSILLLAGLLLGIGLLAAPAQSVAQSTDGPPTLITHLRSELQAKDPMRRQLALLDVNTLAHCTGSCTVSLRSIQDKKIRIENETGMGSVVDLEALVPDLLESYRRGPADGHRLLALSALLHVGNEKGLERLIDEGAFQSDHVRQATQRGLAAFYLEKYPELTERTLRTKRLSLDDVTRAKALRMKKVKMMKTAEESNN